MTAVNAFHLNSWSVPPVCRPERPWPLVPRPFADEALGSWFGRIASRFHMNVNELAAAGQLTLDFGEQCCEWLLLRPLNSADSARLSFLSGIGEENLPRPYVGPATARRQTQLAFCERCLWLNPLDVTAPYWKAEWAHLREPVCRLHGCRFDFVSGITLSTYSNMRRLLAHISTRSQRRRRVSFEPRFGPR